MPAGHELAQQYREIAAATDQEIGELGRLLADLQGRRERLLPQREKAALDLASAHLTALTDPVLAQAERRTGFRGFQRMNPIVARERERGRLRTEIERLRAEERYVRREYLVGPNGTITARLAEARQMLEPWAQECARFEDLPSFLELVQTRYDTDHFERRWWEPAYWRLWAAGDKVCDALGLADFGDDVLPAYEKVREPRDRWKAQVEGIEAERDQVLALVKRHDDDVWRLDHLDEIYLSEACRALAEHLATADPALLEQWAEDDRGVIVATRRLAGLRAKVDHLDLMIEGVGQWAQTLKGRSNEYQRKASKYAYGKKAYRQYPTPRWTKARTTLQKSAERRGKLASMADRLERYDRYDRFDAGSNAPELWWVEQTGSNPHAWMPRLRAWYQQHDVDLVHDGDDDHGAAIAATLAHQRLDGLGDVS
ncbi:MAG: hypothetical protein H6738_22780 [Alphaproteobacteria bacterium]|nr:hypothetical protein [Alphaproteobacteria bacterium]